MRFLYAIAIFFLVAAIHALILRAACTIYNRLAGGGAARSEDSAATPPARQGRLVPEPHFGLALGIVVIANVIALVLAFSLRWAVPTADWQAVPDPRSLVGLLAAALALSILVLAAAIWLAIPKTRFLSCLLVSLIHLLVAIPVTVAAMLLTGAATFLIDLF